MELPACKAVGAYHPKRDTTRPVRCPCHIASFLLEETSIEGTNELKITHETIANHLGSHREVITRMLRYFQGEGLVKLSRGKITILDSKRLETLQRS